jgi:hypothetical protein
MADIQSIRQVAHARTPFSAWFGVVLLFALFGVIVLAVIGPWPRGDTYEQKRAKAREEKLKAAREEDAKALTTYAWIDKNKAVARIPIERAMELTVTELAQKKPVPAGPIATAEQSTVAAAGAAAPSPAATASPSPSGTPKPTSVAGPGSEAHNQPAAAVNPPPAPPGTQPGTSASPAASPAHAATEPNPAKAPQPTPVQSAPSSPLPVRGKETPTATPR